MMPLIQVRGLEKVYRAPGADADGCEVRALDGINLDIQVGEYIAIVGPSGSGKSTLMQILGLLDRPTCGDFFFAGKNVCALKDDDLAKMRSRFVGFVFQFFNLLPRARALENVSLPLVYSACPPSGSRAEELLRQVGLGDRLYHRPHQLSGGQQQRVAIARALANHPQVIFADEPTGNISTSQASEILDLFENLNSQGVTLIVVTHEASVAQRARRRLTIRDGRIAEDCWLRAPTSRAENLLPPIVDPPDENATPRMREIQLKLQENLRMALAALRLNALRSALATLGIVIGIASFVAMVAIGEGAEQAIAKTLSSLGTNNLNIQAVNPRASRSLGGDNFRKLFPEDYDALKFFSLRPEIKAVDAQVYGQVSVTAANKNTTAELVGATPAIEAMQNYHPVSGRFFSEEENRTQARVSLLGQTVAKRLFGDRNPVGSRIKINEIEYEVIGLLPRKGSTAYKDRDEMILTPLKTAMKRVLGRKTLSNLTVEARTSLDVATVETDLTQWLRERRKIHDGEPNDFSILNMNDIQQIYNQTVGIIASMLQAISIVALLVGGTGIMNVMFVSVKERTREVGLRKALGASSTDIMLQFLLESVSICVIGGLMGALLGYTLIVLASEFLGWSTVFSLSSFLVSFAFSFLIGLIFGLWPARTASLLSPIEALRYE